MAIKDQNISTATKKSNTFEVYENRKIYKDKTLMTDRHSPNEPAFMIPGVADFWYDRRLFGKINRTGDIVILREDFLQTLPTNTDKTFYALNFVAVAFDEMRRYVEKLAKTNMIPNQNTLFALPRPAVAWQSVYDNYHDYMSDIYSIFFDYIIENNREDTINNFDDFVEEFFIFCRNYVTGDANTPITLSGFIASNYVDARCGGLTIDLFRARASNDLAKNNTFIGDVNFNFFIDAANRHGFVVDKNVPWRLNANLSSEYMKMLMESPAFDVTYSLGPKNMFDTYYLKTYTLDLILLRKYLYDMYDSLTSSAPTYRKYEFCNKAERTRSFTFSRRQLSGQEKDKKYNVKDYWLGISYRFRLLELDHDLVEQNIANHIKNAKSVHKIRGEMESLRYLHEHCKKFFINSYNKVGGNLIMDPPRHHP